MLENIILPCKGRGVKKEGIKYGEMLGLDKKTLNRFPDELSGGEQQRGAIARALIKKGSILLADEPTGSLDSENEKIVIEQLKKISQEGVTVVIVTHDDWVANQCGRIIYMSDGKIQ